MIYGALSSGFSKNTADLPRAASTQLAGSADFTNRALALGNALKTNKEFPHCDVPASAHCDSRLPVCLPQAVNLKGDLE